MSALSCLRRAVAARSSLALIFVTVITALPMRGYSQHEDKEHPKLEHARQERPKEGSKEASCLPKDPPAPVLQLRVHTPATGKVGEPIEYRICLENASTMEAHHVIVRNPLPSNARFVRSDPEPTRRVPELQWHLGTIGAGAKREVILVLAPTDADDVKNCARVQFEHGQCVVTRLTGRLPGFGKTPQVKDVPPGEEAKLSLRVDGPKQQYANLPARYFLKVSNDGKTAATNLLVTAAVPEQSKFVSASDAGVHVQGQVAWFVGQLDAGASKTVELVLRANAVTEWCVQAEARADRKLFADGEACTKFLGVSAVSVELVDREDPLLRGTQTSYPISVRNHGTAPMTNLQIKVHVPDGLKVVRTTPVEHQKDGQPAPGQWIRFATLPTLAAGMETRYEVFVEGMRVGESRLRIELRADQLEQGPIIEEENTSIFDDEPAGKKL